MGNDSKVLIIVLAIVLIIIPVGYWLVPEPVDDKVRVGDVWEHYAVGDPFVKEAVFTRRVISIKHDYIQFVENERDTLSELTIIFKYNSEKLSSNTQKKDSI